MDTVELKVGVLTDVADVESKFASAGTSVKTFGDDVDSASRKADDATSRLDNAAASADGMASSSSQAAGGIGDLGGALALMPGPLGAVGAGMEAAAPAIMGVTGAADLANLALEGQRISTIRSTIATKASTVATKAHTVAQKALNLAMRANPIGIVITALIVLAGLFVVAYKKSETFRDIVDGVMARGRDAIGWVIDKLESAGEWFGRVKDKGVGAFNAMIEPIRDVIGWVQALIGKLESALQKLGLLDSGENRSDVPNPGGPPPSGGNPNAVRAIAGTGQPTTIHNHYHIDGTLAADPNALGRVMRKVVTEHQTRLGVA